MKTVEEQIAFLQSHSSSILKPFLHPLKHHKQGWHNKQKSQCAEQHSAHYTHSDGMTGLVHLLLTIYNASDISSETKQSDNGKRSRMLLNHFFELVSENAMTGQRSISFYAEQLCVSARYLFKVCKKETGQTPKVLINQSLIGEIKNALLTTEMSHQQIADRFGFPDQSAFGQFFKRQEGISPSEFRKKYK